METILITGGTGLIGTRLSEILSQNGYSVRHLSRRQNDKSLYPVYKWNVSERYLDPNALTDVDHIIHLAGDNVSDGRWTDAKKARMLSSRVDTANLIFSHLKKDNNIKSYISASGISIYGAKTTNTIFNENIDEIPNDFLATLTEKWEKSTYQFSEIVPRVICLRTPIVMSPTGGALGKMVPPIKLGIGSALGSGEQHMPWIHLDDICYFYMKSISDSSLEGTYNANADCCTNLQMTEAIAKTLNKNLWAPKVPAFVINILLGEMSEIVLKGSALDNKKMLDTGFRLKFPKLSDALKDCLKK